MPLAKQIIANQCKYHLRIKLKDKVKIKIIFPLNKLRYLSIRQYFIYHLTLKQLSTRHFLNKFFFFLSCCFFFDFLKNLFSLLKKKNRILLLFLLLLLLFNNQTKILFMFIYFEIIKHTYRFLIYLNKNKQNTVLKKKQLFSICYIFFMIFWFLYSNLYSLYYNFLV
jgi:hypothetical protein